MGISQCRFMATETYQATYYYVVTIPAAIFDLGPGVGVFQNERGLSDPPRTMPGDGKLGSSGKLRMIARSTKRCRWRTLCGQSPALGAGLSMCRTGGKGREREPQHCAIRTTKKRTRSPEPEVRTHRLDIEAKVKLLSSNPSANRDGARSPPHRVPRASFALGPAAPVGGTVGPRHGGARLMAMPLLLLDAFASISMRDECTAGQGEEGPRKTEFEVPSIPRRAHQEKARML